MNILMKEMKTKKLTFLLALTFLFLFSGFSVVFADDLQDGLDAYDRKDYKTAYKLFLPFAEQGHASAQKNLGNMYRKGEGVPQDYKEAFKWYRLSAEQGDALGQTNLGMCYVYEIGVTKDDKEAVKWFKKAAEQGYALAQSNLGAQYDRGEGIPKTTKKQSNGIHLQQNKVKNLDNPTWV